MTATTAITAAVPATAAARARRGERGSAFIIALLVLLVLTIAGLALTLMTQTEMRIGANERETNRTFYAADSGIHVSTARTLWLGVSQQQIPPILLNTTQQDQNLSSAPPLTFADQVTVTPLFQMRSDTLLPKSSINQNQQIRYVKATYAVNATSTRVGQNGTSSPYTQTMAQKVVAAMIAIQPSTESLNYNPPTGLKQ
jgi:PilX N-terminal